MACPPPFWGTVSGQVPPRCYQRDAPSTYSAKWEIAEPDSFHSGRNKFRTSYTTKLTGRRPATFDLGFRAQPPLRLSALLANDILTLMCSLG